MVGKYILRYANSCNPAKEAEIRKAEYAIVKCSASIKLSNSPALRAKEGNALRAASGHMCFFICLLFSLLMCS